MPGCYICYIAIDHFNKYFSIVNFIQTIFSYSGEKMRQATLQVSEEGIPGQGNEKYTKWEGFVIGYSNAEVCTHKKAVRIFLALAMA